MLYVVLPFQHRNPFRGLVYENEFKETTNAKVMGAVETKEGGGWRAASGILT